MSFAQQEKINDEKDDFADRIRTEADEIEKIQARTFTKALNSAALKDEPVEELFKDLRDGKRLLKIVNFFTTSKLLPERGSSNIHFQTNVNKCLDTLQNNNVEFVNIQAEKLVSGNEKITLGIVWTILHHFQVKLAMKNVNLDEDHAPDVVLMAWVKRQIHRYVIPLYNFKSCWVDGKIFCAILLNNGLLDTKHSWEKLCDLSAEQRIELAFKMAQNRLKIAPILEAADLMEKPDSKCIQLYVSYLYEELKDYETSGTDAISGHNSLKSLVQLVMISRSLEGSNKLKEQAHTLIKKLREVKNSAENINLEDGLENVEVLHKLHDENELRIQDIESLRDEVESIRRDLKDPISKELWELFMLTAHVVESLQQRLGVLVLDKFQEVTKLWYNQIEIIGQKVEKLDFSLENSEILLNSLLELKSAVDSVSSVIDDFPIHASTEEDRRAVLAVARGRNYEIEKRISQLKKFEEAKAKFKQTEVRFGEAQLEKALQRDKDKFTRLLQEYNDCAFELLDLLDEVLDRSLITQIKSKIDYWSQIMESQLPSSPSSSSLESYSSNASLPSDLDDLMRSEKYGGSLDLLCGSIDFTDGGSLPPPSPNLVEPPNFENVDPRDVEVIFPQRHHIALKPMVSLVAEETEDQVRAMQETSASETEDSPQQKRKSSLKVGSVKRGRTSCGSIMEEKENDDDKKTVSDRSSPKSDDFQPGESEQAKEEEEHKNDEEVTQKMQKTLTDISSGTFELEFRPSYDIAREMELKEALGKRIDEAKRVQEGNYGERSLWSVSEKVTWHEGFIARRANQATEAFVALERIINRKMAEEEIKTVAEKILEQKSASEIVKTPEAVRKISKEEVEDVFKSLKRQSSEQPLVDKVIDNIVDDIVKGKRKDEDDDFELIDEDEIKIAAEASKQNEETCDLPGKFPSPVLVDCPKQMEDSGINLPDIVPQQPIKKKENVMTMQDSGVGELLPEPQSAEQNDRPSTPLREEIAILEGKIAQLDESIDLKDDLTDSSLDLYDNFDNMASPTPKSPLPAVDYDLFGSISPSAAAEAPAQPSTQPRKSVVFSDHVQEKMISPASSMSSNERIDAEDYFTRSDDEKAKLEAELDELMDGFTEEIEKREKTPEQKDLLGTFKLDSSIIREEVDSEQKEYFPVEILKDQSLPKETEIEEVKTVDTQCDLEAVSKLEDTDQSISHEADVINTDPPADSLSKEDDVEKEPKEKEEIIENSEKANFMTSSIDTCQESIDDSGDTKTTEDPSITGDLKEKKQNNEDKFISFEAAETSELIVVEQENRPEQESEKEIHNEIHDKIESLSEYSEKTIEKLEQVQNMTSETNKITEFTDQSETNEAIASKECVTIIEKTSEFMKIENIESKGEVVDQSERVLEKENTEKDREIPIQSEELSPENIELQNDSPQLKTDSFEDTVTETTAAIDSTVSTDQSTTEIESLAALTVSEILQSAQVQAKSNQAGDKSKNHQEYDDPTAINEDTPVQRQFSEKEIDPKSSDETQREKFDVPPQFKEIPFEPIKEKEIEVILTKEDDKDVHDFIVEKDEPKLEELKSSETVSFGENQKIRTEKVLSFPSFSTEKSEVQQTVISSAPEAVPTALAPKEEEINLEENLQEIPKEAKEMSSQGSIQRILDSSGDFDDDNLSESDEQSSKDQLQKEDELSDAETTSQSTIKASPSMTTMDSVDVSGSYDQSNDAANVPSDRFSVYCEPDEIEAESKEVQMKVSSTAIEVTTETTVTEMKRSESSDTLRFTEEHTSITVSSRDLDADLEAVETAASVDEADKIDESGSVSADAVASEMSEQKEKPQSSGGQWNSGWEGWDEDQWKEPVRVEIKPQNIRESPVPHIVSENVSTDTEAGYETATSGGEYDTAVEDNNTSTDAFYSCNEGTDQEDNRASTPTNDDVPHAGNIPNFDEFSFASSQNVVDNYSQEFTTFKDSIEESPTDGVVQNLSGFNFRDGCTIIETVAKKDTVEVFDPQEGKWYEAQMDLSNIEEISPPLSKSPLSSSKHTLRETVSSPVLISKEESTSDFIQEQISEENSAAEEEQNQKDIEGEQQQGNLEDDLNQAEVDEDEKKINIEEEQKQKASSPEPEVLPIVDAEPQYEKDNEQDRPASSDEEEETTNEQNFKADVEPALPENVKIVEDEQEIIIAEKVHESESLKIDVNSVTTSVTTSYEIIDVKKVVVDMPVVKSSPLPAPVDEEDSRKSSNSESSESESEAESVKAKSASPESMSITVSEVTKSSEISEESTMVVLNVETRKSTGELRFIDTPTPVNEVKATSGKAEENADETENIIVAEKINDTVTEQLEQASKALIGDKDLGTIEEEARTATKWSEEMLDDFGVKELTWTKEKAQLDLENLNKAYKTLDEFDTSDDSISEATKRCREALEEAIAKLNDLVEDLNISIDYEGKIKFLNEWLEKVETQITNEPFNVTVKDQLEKNIEKYEKLNEVINEKEKIVCEVIQHGEELAERAKTKQESYKTGVSNLDEEWKRVTKMVEARTNKLSEWSVSLHKYEEVYVGTVRSCDDLAHEVSKLEESVLEEVDLADIMNSIETLKEQIENVKKEAEAIIEDFEKTENGTDKCHFLELTDSVPENLKADCKDLDKRLQQIRTNQELSLKLAEKGTTVVHFVDKANAVLDSDRLPADPAQLQKQLDLYEQLELEFEDLEVVVKMISDWSVEIQKGPNPSRNVDDMESLLTDQMNKIKRSIDTKADIFRNLNDNWAELKEAFNLVEQRSAKIKEELEESDTDTVKLAKIIDETEINRELQSIQEMINVFLDGNMMSDYLEEKGQAISSDINSKIAEAQRAIRASSEQEKSEEIGKWVESSSQSVHKADSLGELQNIHEKIQQFANDVDQNDDVQEKLVALDDLVRDRLKALSEKNDCADKTRVVKNELQIHITLLETMESAGETAVDKPAEFQIALNTIASLEEEYHDLPEFIALKEKIETLRLPKGTNERTTTVEAKLSNSEARLATTQVTSVSLCGATIEEAKTAVTQVYTDLVTVKNDLEQLISTKRKLNDNGFIDKDAAFSLSLVALRERFNNIGKQITDSKVALSKSARRVQKLKRAVEDTDQWAQDVLAQSIEQYSMDNRERMASDAEVRKREVLEATEDCVNKLESNLNADCSQLVADVHQGLKSTETLVTALRNDSLPSDTSSEMTESKEGIKGINVTLSKIEVELEDSTLGVSNPKYITRQAEILSTQREKLDEVKAYLETEDNEDNPNLRVIAVTKSKDLEETYTEKKKAFDAVAAIWSGFEMECNALLEDLRPENISHEVVVDAADRLKALKFKVNSAKEPATSPRKGDSKAQEMLEQAQSLIDNFEDQKTMKIEQTDEQKSEEIAKTYENVQEFVKSSVMVYGCNASVHTVEQHIESFEKCLLVESTSAENEEKIQKINSLIQKKKTEIQIVKETTKQVKEIQSMLVVELETTHQTFIDLGNKSTNTAQESHDLLEQYEELDNSMLTITSKQNQIRHAVLEANDKYDLNFEIKDDILCEKIIDGLQADLTTAQRVTVDKMNAQQVIFEAEQTLSNISASSDLEAELETHRKALEKISVTVDNYNLSAKFNEVDAKISAKLDRSESVKKRIEVDVDHWRNISGSLEEYAAWIVSKQPSSEIGDLSSSSSVEEALNKKANDCGMLLVEMEAKQSVIETALESSAEAIKSFKKLGVEETTLESSTQAVLENLKDRQAETKDAWGRLRADVNARKELILRKIESLKSFKEKNQIVYEICDRHKDKIPTDDVKAGEVFITEIKKQIKTELAGYSELEREAEAVLERWESAKKEKESSKNASRPASIIMEEPITMMIQEEPVMSQPDSPDDTLNPDVSLNARSSAESSNLQPGASEAVHSRPVDWERQEKDNGVPFYVNHMTQKTVWTHPTLTEFLNGLQPLNKMRFSAYRTAIKLRKIQKKLTLDYFNIDNLQKAFRTVSPDPNATIEVIVLAEILYDLYESSKQRAQQADLTLNWLLSVFNPKREGTIPVLCVKVGLVALCGAQLEQKYRYLFTAASGAKKTMNKEGLKALVYALVQIPYHLKEHVAFVGTELDVDPTVTSCFEHSGNPKSVTLHMEDFMKWCSLEPQSMVWVPVIHRLISAEKVTHNVKCQCCNNKDFTGFRYKSLKRFRHDLCQECFLYGKANEKGLVHYPLVEYYNATGTSENIRDFMRTAKNKLSRKKKNKRPPLGYLPINPQRSASFDNSRNSNNSTLNTSGNDESLNIPSTPEKNGLKTSKSENDTSLSSIKERSETTELEKEKIKELSAELSEPTTR